MFLNFQTFRNRSLLASIVVLCCLIISSCVGVNTVAKKTYAYTDFNAIAFNGSFDATITTGDTYKIELEGSQELLDAIKVIFWKNNSLTIEQKNTRSFGDNKKIKATITLPMLAQLDLSGNIQLNAQLTPTPKFTLNQQGAGKTNLSGSTDTLTLNVAGCSNVNTAKLSALDVTIKASGASDIEVQANSKLNIEAFGNATIKYHGSPKIQQNIAGAVTIQKVG